MLHDDIKASLKEAMKAKDGVKLRTVRSMLTAFTNELVATGKKPNETLQDDGVLSVIKRLAKQRKESIVQFEAGKRQDLADPEKEELKLLESYLPQMMSQEEIEPIAKAKLAELGLSDPNASPDAQASKSKIGQAVGVVMKELKGKADGGDVKAVVEKLLS